MSVNLEDAKWYVLHTYSGYENMVKENLEMVFTKNGKRDRLLEITVPMEDVVEEKNGKRKIFQRRMFPCYVLIKMVYDNSMWHMIVNTRGVTGFVGPMGRPIPLTEDEIKRMHLEKLTVTTEFKVGDKVRHLKFGNGVVTDVVDTPGDKEITVDFERVGVKTMYASMVKMKKL